MSAAAEYAVIGSCLLDPACIDQLDGLQPDDFDDGFCRQVYGLIRTLHAEAAAIDVLTVHQRAEALRLDLPLAELGRAVNDTPTSANVTAYARAVQDAATLRRLHAASRQLATIADSAGTADDKLAEAQAVLAGLEARTQAGVLEPIGLRLAEMVDRLDARVQAGGGITGLASGFPDLDHLTSGFHPGDLIIVAARPAMGKTAFAMNLAEHGAMALRQPVAVFSLEMPTSQILERLIAGRARVGAQGLRTGRIGTDDWPRIAHSMGELAQTPLYLNDTPALSVPALRAMARKLKREHGLSLIVVDYLQLMQSGTRENRTQEISEISRGLKGLAKELQVPVIALSQLNRGLEQRANKRPVMSDLRESGAIEQDADLILGLYRDEVYDPESTARGTAEVILLKQRNGPLGTVRLTFLGEQTRFESYAGPAIPLRKLRAPKSWRGGMDD